MTRTACSVPGCRRSRPRDSRYAEWVCGDHWRAVPQADRRAYTVAKRDWRKGRTDADPDVVWARCKRLAIEAAAGL